MDADGSVRFDKPLPPSESASSTEGKKLSASSESQPIASSNYISRKFYTGPIIDFIYKRVFIRNTKDSINRDYDVPQVTTLDTILDVICLVL